MQTPEIDGDLAQLLDMDTAIQSQSRAYIDREKGQEPYKIDYFKVRNSCINADGSRKSLDFVKASMNE
jgi:hypothetical protein